MKTLRQPFLSIAKVVVVQQSNTLVIKENGDPKWLLMMEKFTIENSMMENVVTEKLMTKKLVTEKLVTKNVTIEKCGN